MFESVLSCCWSCLVVCVFRLCVLTGTVPVCVLTGTGSLARAPVHTVDAVAMAHGHSMFHYVTSTPTSKESVTTPLGGLAPTTDTWPSEKR